MLVKSVGKNCNPLEFFAHPLKALDKPLKGSSGRIELRVLEVFLPWCVLFLISEFFKLVLKYLELRGVDY